MNPMQCIRSLFQRSHILVLRIGLLCAMVTCSCSFAIEVETSPFKEVVIATCQETEQGVCQSKVETFTNQEQQLCVSAEAIPEDSAIELFPLNESVGFTVTWYYARKSFRQSSALGAVASNGYVIVSDCITNTTVGDLHKGKYYVIITLGSTEIGKVNFSVE